MKVEVAVWLALVVLDVQQWSAAAIPSVVVPVPFIRAQLGDSTNIGCIYNKGRESNPDQLRIVWYFYQGDAKKVVHSYSHGGDRVEAQHPDFRGRAHFFQGEISNGNASLRLSNVRLSDAGRYQCLVVENEDVSHDDGNIEIYAPYKNGKLSLTRKGEVLSATCKFWDGYPGSEIVWRYSDGREAEQQGKTQLGSTFMGTYDLKSSVLTPMTADGALCCSLKDYLNQNGTVCKNVAETQKHNHIWLGTTTVCVFIIIVAAAISCHGTCNCCSGDIRTGHLRSRHQALKATKLPYTQHCPNGVRPKFSSCPPRIQESWEETDHPKCVQGFELQHLQPQAERNRISVSTCIALMGLPGHRKEFLLMFCHRHHRRQCVIWPMAAAGDRGSMTMSLGEGLRVTNEKDFEYSPAYHHRLWQKYLKDAKPTDNGKKQKERVIFVFVHRCTEPLDKRRKQEIKDLFNFLKTHTGSFPVTVLMNSSTQKTSDVMEFFCCLGCCEVLTFQTPKPENMQDSKERDDKIRSFIHTCLCRSHMSAKKKQSPGTQVVLESNL